MSSYNLKAKNKKTGEMVNVFKTCTERWGSGYQEWISDKFINEKKFNKLYDLIDNELTIENEIVDNNHPYGGMEVETKCDCCGWDDNGYQHEPQCSSLKTETWRDRFLSLFNETDYFICPLNNDICQDKIADFFQQELERICEEVEKERYLHSKGPMYKSGNHSTNNADYIKGYNLAIDDIINIIKK